MTHRAVETPVDESQRTAARVARFTCLFTMAVVVFVNFGIHARLIVAGNAAETARNMLTHERLFRIGIACDLIYCAGLVVLLTALYAILKPVNRGLALLAAFWRLVYALMWVLMTLNLFETLRLAGVSEAIPRRELRRVLRWLAVLCIGIHSLRLLVVQVGLYPENLGCLGGDLVCILRRVYFRFHHFSRLRQGSQPVVVRFADGHLRNSNEFLASV